MEISSFYDTSIFKEEIKNYDNFSTTQVELLLDKSETAPNNQLAFAQLNVSYDCSFEERDLSPEKPAILIPIRDNSELLEFTISNLKKNDLHEIANIIIIDDRSEENLQEVCKKEQVSYLRVDNKKGFNFSALNNIAAKICHDRGLKTVIMWNSDLWCVEKDFFIELMKRHKENNSKVSGTKLVYPPSEFSLHDEEDTSNIVHHFPSMAGKWRNTLQFGGGSWIPVPSGNSFFMAPSHHKRFQEIDNPMANSDKQQSFVTGALHVWDLEYFVSLGGFFSSMSKNFQDVDICLRSCFHNNIYPWYFGKDIHFYHDESLSILKEKKEDEQFVSDHSLFFRIWNAPTLSKILL